MVFKMLACRKHLSGHEEKAGGKVCERRLKQTSY